MSNDMMTQITNLLNEEQEALQKYEQERTETVQKALRESGIEAFVQQTNVELARRRGKIEALKALLPNSEGANGTPSEDRPE